jgi:hypothetical protein
MPTRTWPLHDLKAIPRGPKAFGAGTAMSATRENDTNDLNIDRGERAAREMKTSKGKVTRSGAFGGYEVTGWRYMEDTSWQIKVWPTGHPGGWIGYTVTAGQFELKVLAEDQKNAVLHLIAEWDGQV